MPLITPGLYSPLGSAMRLPSSRASGTPLGLATDLVNAPATITPLEFARASTAYDVDAGGLLTPFAAGGPRTGQTVGNYLRNPRAESSGAPALPYYWLTQAWPSGVTGTLVGTGTEDGIPYADVLITGTPATTSGNPGSILRVEDTALISTKNGDTWNVSAYLRVISGSLANAPMTLGAAVRTSVGGLAQSIITSVTPTTAALSTQRYSTPCTVTQATATSLDPVMRFTFTSGQAVNVVLRIGGLQCSRGTPLLPLMLPPVGVQQVSLLDAATPAPGLLIEGSATNLVQRSETLDNAYWNKNNSTVTADAAAAPNGSLTADLLVEAATTTVHELSSGSSVTITAGGSYSVSIYAKNAWRTQFELRAIIGADGISALFDLGSVSVSSPINTGTASGAVGRIEALANGWYRCIVSGIVSTTGGTTGYLRLRMASAGATSYAGDGVSGLYLWGAQIEASPVATSYIPTTTATASRAADLVTVTGSQFATLFGDAQQGWIICDVLLPASTSPAIRVVARLDDGTESNKIELRPNGAGTVAIVVTNIGGTQTTTPSITAPAYGSVSRWGMRWGPAGVACSVNGSAVASYAPGALPAFSALRLGGGVTGNIPLNGRILGVWAGRGAISDSKFTAATALGADLKRLLGS